jgi:hypothetical protein
MLNSVQYFAVPAQVIGCLRSNVKPSFRIESGVPAELHLQGSVGQYRLQCACHALWIAQTYQDSRRLRRIGLLEWRRFAAARDQTSNLLRYAADRACYDRDAAGERF